MISHVEMLFADCRHVQDFHKRWPVVLFVVKWPDPSDKPDFAAVLMQQNLVTTADEMYKDLTERHERRTWLDEHAGKGQWGTHLFYIGFSDPDVAFAFKLRWL